MYKLNYNHYITYLQYKLTLPYFTTLHDTITDIVGGPCKSFNYVLERIDIHWGENDACGSEHLINTTPSAAEVVVVVVKVVMVKVVMVVVGIMRNMKGVG